MTSTFITELLKFADEKALDLILWFGCSSCDFSLCTSIDTENLKKKMKILHQIAQNPNLFGHSRFISYITDEDLLLELVLASTAFIIKEREAFKKFLELGMERAEKNKENVYLAMCNTSKVALELVDKFDYELSR